MQPCLSLVLQLMCVFWLLDEVRVQRTGSVNRIAIVISPAQEAPGRNAQCQLYRCNSPTGECQAVDSRAQGVLLNKHILGERIGSFELTAWGSQTCRRDPRSPEEQ